MAVFKALSGRRAEHMIKAYLKGLNAIATDCVERKNKHSSLIMRALYP